MMSHKCMPITCLDGEGLERYVDQWNWITDWITLLNIALICSKWQLLYAHRHTPHTPLS